MAAQLSLAFANGGEPGFAKPASHDSCELPGLQIAQAHTLKYCPAHDTIIWYMYTGNT